MNSKTAQLTENGTEIVRLFARFALGASFLSAVADRFGLWGPHGAKNVSWGDFAHFVEYTGAVMSLFPSSLTVSFAWAATVAETLFGILLIAGFKTRMASVLSGLLLLSFAMGMVTGLGIKTPFEELLQRSSGIPPVIMRMARHDPGRSEGTNSQASLQG